MSKTDALKAELIEELRKEISREGWSKYFSVRDDKGNLPIGIVFSDETIEEALNAVHRAGGSVNLVVSSEDESKYLLNVIRLTEDQHVINFDNTMNIVKFAEWMLESDFHRNVVLVSNQGRTYKVMNARRMPFEQ